MRIPNQKSLAGDFAADERVYVGRALSTTRTESCGLCGEEQTSRIGNQTGGRVFAVFKDLYGNLWDLLQLN
jgi:hypothetical protein